MLVGVTLKNFNVKFVFTNLANVFIYAVYAGCVYVNVYEVVRFQFGFFKVNRFAATVAEINFSAGFSAGRFNRFNVVSRRSFVRMRRKSYIAESNIIFGGKF